MASLPVKMYIGHAACDTRQLQYRRITLSSWGRIYGRDTYVPKDRITCCLHAHCGGDFRFTRTSFLRTSRHILPMKWSEWYGVIRDEILQGIGQSRLPCFCFLSLFRCRCC